jgi:hypothetical protein
VLKKTIEYEDFNGEKVSEDFYFNLSKPELLELEVGYNGGSFSTAMKRLVDAKDTGALISEFKKLILASYGQKSEDGKRFIKSDALREEFSQTAAFNELFMALATDDKIASSFVIGILPADMAAELKKAELTQSTTVKPPPAPTQ